ncbi:N-acetylglucosamine kinase 1 [Lecanora helva]
MPDFEVTLDNFLEEVQQAFEQQLQIDSLLSISKELQAEFKQHLISSPQCMLPSFNYILPTGEELGTYLALEVGGSNLRMALVELLGRRHEQESMRIKHTLCFPIDSSVRQLQDHAFFDWMAEKIREMLLLHNETKHSTEETEPLRMGVAWSFPIDQKSVRSGNVLGMGKGFNCSDSVKGHDLGEIISQACERASVNVRLDAIVNDSSSTLLALAYLDPATRMACILGTGMNVAIHLPIKSLHPSKFASRSIPQNNSITHVLTNTEFSMYGKHIFPTTKWDDLLNERHILPNYQPFEYLVAGGYLGEIVRLILAEATYKAGLFASGLPPSLNIPYTLDTKTLAQIELDSSPSLSATSSLLQQQYSLPQALTYADAHFIRQTILFVTTRSIAYFTAGIYALSSLLQELEHQAGLEEDGLDHITIGCDGSVINKYPGYMDRAQSILERMREAEEVEGGVKRKRVVLERTVESAVRGAGVAGALAALDEGGDAV